MGFTSACGWLALSSVIAAAPQTATTTQRSAANASFTYVSDDGCIQNEVVVFASRTTVVSRLPARSRLCLSDRIIALSCCQRRCALGRGTCCRLCGAFLGRLT